MSHRIKSVRMPSADELLEHRSQQVRDETLSGIWKVHAEVWRAVREEYRRFLEDEEHAIKVGDPAADTLAVVTTRELHEFAEFVANVYESKASNPAKESEG